MMGKNVVSWLSGLRGVLSSYGKSSSVKAPDSPDMSPEASGMLMVCGVAVVWLRDWTLGDRVLASVDSTDHWVATS